MQLDENVKTVRNAAKISFGVVFSRVLGLARDVALVYVLGGGWIADIFLAAFRLPQFARRLFYDGAIAMAFLPFFNKLKMQKGNEEAFAFGRAAIVQFLIGALIIALVCVYASHSIALILVPGFASEHTLIDMAAQLMKITFFYFPLVVVASIVSGMLLAFEHYMLPSLSTSCTNIGIICAALLAVFGGYSGINAAIMLCYGLLIGGLMQVIVQLPVLYKNGFKIFGRVSFYSSEAKSFARKAPQTMFGSAAYQLGVLIAMFMASFLGEGNVTALYLAEKIFELPLAIVGIALGTASLGNFSYLVIRGRKAELTTQLHDIIALGLCFSLPSAFGCLALALPIMGAFFAHGAFSDYSLDLTVRALVFYTPILPALVMSRPILSALNASGRAATTMFIAVLSLLILVGSSLLLLNFMDIEAITISSSIAAWFNTIVLILLLRRCKVCEPGVRFFPWKSFITYTVYSLVMFAVLMFMQMVADYIGLGYISRTIIGIPLGVAVYVLLCVVFRSPEMAMVRNSMRSK